MPRSLGYAARVRQATAAPQRQWRLAPAHGMLSPQRVLLPNLLGGLPPAWSPSQPPARLRVLPRSRPSASRTLSFSAPPLAAAEPARRGLFGTSSHALLDHAGLVPISRAFFILECAVRLRQQISGWSADGSDRSGGVVHLFSLKMYYNINYLPYRAKRMTRDEFDRSIVANCDAAARRMGLPCMTPREVDALWRRYVEGRNGVLFDVVARGEVSASPITQ